MARNEQISYTQEVLRKAIHLNSLAIPVVYFFISKALALAILLPITAIVVIADVGRHYVGFINVLFTLLFGRMLREHEQTGSGLRLAGATPMMIAAVATIAIFPKSIAITSLCVLIVSDASAALIGRKWGRIHFLGKSLEGTLAFIVSGFAVVMILTLAFDGTSRFFLAGEIAVVVGGIVEVLSGKLRIDDNFSIPLSVGVVMVGMLALLG